MAWVVGIDVGGTFTDVYAIEERTGRTALHKLPSTPDNPAKAIAKGCLELFESERIEPSALARLCHGTTVATNALIQRRGGKVALVVTKGFRDLLEIGRQVRPKLYDFQEDFPAPIVPRERRFELSERILWDGSVQIEPSEEDIEEVARQVARSNVHACAVCFLFAFANSSHERRVADAIRRLAPGVDVSISSDVQPEFREYERLLTTTLNAYLQPVMSRYLSMVEEEFLEIAAGAHIGVNQSSGGLMSLGRARALPIRTALSGPAAGAMGAIDVARSAGRCSVITLDMGGTSADVALIRDGQVGFTFERSLEGYPVRLPSLDIHAVGAGGGSIAWFDKDGLLKVGPESAGAVPGPACYRRGGTRPTVSDANLILGRLSTGGLLGGAMSLDEAAARDAFSQTARQLGFTIEKAAQGVVAIVVSNMVRAIRGVSVERGIDPREFSLLAFGGAGPLHASDVARSLGMREVIVPTSPGILCAQGLIVSDLKETFVQTRRIRLDEGSGELLVAEFARLAEATEEWFKAEEVEREDRSVEAALDMRYVGQNFELSVPLPGKDFSAVDVEGVRRAFLAAHEQNYGYSSADDVIEIVNLRLTAFGRLAVDPERPALQRENGPAQPAGWRDVYFTADAPVRSAIFRRADLQPGHTIDGPAVIEQFDATTVVFPHDKAHVDDAFNIIIEVTL